MTVHISAKENQIAKNVILTGDPLRAKLIANTFLERSQIVSKTRGNNIYTGTTKTGLELSVMASGMGLASIGIYSEELFRFYGVDKIIRIGTAGSYQKSIVVGDTIIVISCCTDSNRNRLLFNHLDYAPTAGTNMLYQAMINCLSDPKVHFGIINSSETFYQDNCEQYVQNFAKGGVLGVEMESANLYTTAKIYGKEALTVLLVSDSLVDSRQSVMSEKERETNIDKNVNIALEIFKNK